MKKILSLFALLVAIVTGAKADVVTLFDASDLDGATVTSGTVTMDNSKWYGGNSASVDNGKTIGGVAWTKRIKFGGGSTFQKGSNFSRVLEVTVPSAGTLNVYFLSGSKGKTRYVYVSQNPSSTIRDVNTAIFSASDDGNDGNVASGEVEAGSYYIWCAENIGVMGVTFEATPATSPNITTQPEDVTYIKGSETCDNMTVEATPLNPGDILGYQWQYSLNGDTFGAIPAMLVPSAEDPTLIGTEAIALIKNMSSIPDQVYIRCVVSETGAEDAISNVANVYIVDGEAPTISITADKNVALKGGEVKLTATVTGTPAPTIQWYIKEGELIQAMEGATSAEFNIATSEYCTFQCFARATNGAGEADSDPIAITVKPALQSVKFSNGVYGAIKEPTVDTENGTIEVPYVYGTDEPTLIADYIQVYNDDEAQIGLGENTIDVISGDVTATYDIEYVSVGAKEVTEDIEGTFSSDDIGDWVFNKYGYEWSETEASKQKGMKFAKAVDGADNMRIAKGNTRQYYFVGPAKSMTLTAVEKVAGKSSIRKVNLYVNGTLIKSDVNNNELGTITLDETGTNLVMIEAAEGTSGDGGFSAYSLKAATIPTVTLNSDGFATFSSTEDVAAEGATVYYASGVQGGYLFLTQTSDNRVAADGGYILVGEPGATVTFSTIPMDIEPEDGNLLYPTTTATASPIEVPTNPTDGSPDALTLDGKVFKTFTGATFNANKAYLVKHEIVDAMGGNTLEIKFAEATGVNGVAEAKAEVAPAKVIKNGQLFIGNYNIAGQQVK